MIKLQQSGLSWLIFNFSGECPQQRTPNHRRFAVPPL